MLYDRRRDLSQESRDLLAAAEYLRAHGWCQRTTYGSTDPDSPACIVGALWRVTQSHERTKHVSDILFHRLGDVNLVAWNDTRGRTVDEVLDLLERAAWS